MRDMNRVGLAVLRRAQIEPPAGFDGAGMMEDIEGAFLRQTIRQAGSEPAASLADVRALKTLVVHASRAHASLSRALESAIIKGRLDGAFQRELPADMGAFSVSLALDVIRALEVAARQTVPATKEAVGQIPLEGSRAKGAPRAGWLVAEALPEIAHRHLGIAASFTPAGNGQPSPCIRFIQAAHATMNKEPPLDTAIIQTVSRWKKANLT